MAAVSTECLLFNSELSSVLASAPTVVLFRVASKAYAAAQNSAMQDLVKWSLKDENRAIQDALTQVTAEVSLFGAFASAGDSSAVF